MKFVFQNLEERLVNAYGVQYGTADVQFVEPGTTVLMADVDVYADRPWATIDMVRLIPLPNTSFKDVGLIVAVDWRHENGQRGWDGISDWFVVFNSVVRTRHLGIPVLPADMDGGVNFRVYGVIYSDAPAQIIGIDRVSVSVSEAGPREERITFFGTPNPIFIVEEPASLMAEQIVFAALAAPSADTVDSVDTAVPTAPLLRSVTVIDDQSEHVRDVDATETATDAAFAEEETWTADFLLTPAWGLHIGL